MSSALIGYTGFVGSNLMRQCAFDELYNSRNIEDIRGRSFERIVCAGVSAVKWWANLHPEEDRAGIKRLVDCLDAVTCGKFILISTIDVYGSPCGETERDTPTRDGLHAYGRHRLELEDFVRSRFPNALVVRLPALFGHGLKKNVIFDLMHRNQLDVVNPRSAFQWYDVGRMGRDLEAIEVTGIPIFNIVAEPVEVGTIRDRFFPGIDIGGKAGASARYDLRTLYPEVLGGRGAYHFTQAQTLADLEKFLAASGT